MAVFPAFDPVYPASKKSQSSSQKIALGDGYEKSSIFGLNSVKPEWELTWIREAEEIDIIDGFLQARADIGEIFEWQPPDSTSLFKWRCDEWEVQQDTYGVLKLTATFRRVFDIQPPIFTPGVATCDDDALCESDYGSYDPNFLGQADAWVARLQNEDSGIHSSNSYTFDDGYIYLAYFRDEQINDPLMPGGIISTFCLAKFKPSGQVVWVRRYNQLADRWGYYPGNNIIMMTADEKNNKIFVAWQLDEAGGDLYSSTTATRHSIACISVNTGECLWRTFFNFSAYYTSYFPFYGTETIQGLFFEIRYYPELRKLCAYAQPGTGKYICCEFDSSNGAGLIQYEYSSNSISIKQLGYLGSQPYTLLGARNVAFLIQGHTLTPSGIGIYPTTPDPSLGSTGMKPEYTRMLNNRQAVAVFIHTTPGIPFEIMIIGENGQIVDHAKYSPASTQFGWISSLIGIPKFAYNWPSYLDQPRMGGVTNEASVDTVRQKLHLSGPRDFGALNIIIDVTINSSGRITQLGNFSGISYLAGQQLSQSGGYGSNKYTSFVSTSPRITFSNGGYPSNEVALLSFNRGVFNNIAGPQAFSVTNGSEIGQYIGPAATVASVSSLTIAPSRTGLQGFLSQADSLTTYGSQYASDEQYAGYGTKFFKWVSSPVTSFADITSTEIFNLYTFKQNV
jgi:phage-related protein